MDDLFSFDSYQISSSSQSLFTLWIFSSFFFTTLGVIIGICVEKYLRNHFEKKASPISSKKINSIAKDSTNIAFSSKLPVKDKIPDHIAVIMDGNRRFGRKKFSDPLQGHWVGGQTLIDFVQWCIEFGIKMTTVYAFSTENWNRDPLEITTLMTIFAKYAEPFREEALKRNVKVIILSTELDRLPPKVRTSIEELVVATADCSGFQINICLSYGSRSEIVRACKSLVAKGIANKMQDASHIDEKSFANELLTTKISDPDLLIRTSGEYRLSNFLLWQLAYTELFFVDKHWPEITKGDLESVLKEYARRQRRFGV